jgi:altronate dehydratase
VAQQIASYFQNLNEDVEVAGHRDCIDNAVNMRRLLSYLIHPNVGASLIVGHGCEYLEAEKMCTFVRTQGKRESGWLNIQSAGGTLKTIERGKEIVSDLLEKTA